MIKRILSIFALLLLLGLPCLAWGETFYVAQTGSGNGDGSSYVNRMSINNHNGTTFNPGDTIYLIGTIRAEVIVPSSGNQGNKITYRGDLPGHRGIVDRGYTSINQQAGIQLAGKDYIVLDSIEVRNAGYGIIGYGGCDYVTIKRCTIHDCLDRGIFFTYAGGDNTYITIGGASGDGNTIYDVGTGTSSADIDITGATHDVVISYNHLYATKSNGNLGDRGIDGIVFEGGVYNALIEYNTIHSHNDNYGSNARGENAIDLKSSHDVIIRFNRFYESDYEQQIVIHWGTYNTYIYGNLFYDQNSDPVDGWENAFIVPYEGGGSPAAVHDIYIWSNVFYDSEDRGIWVFTGNHYDIYIINNIFANIAKEGILFSDGNGASSNYVVKNNIFYEVGTSTRYQQIEVASGITSGVNLDYNRYYYSGQSVTFDWGGVSKTLAQLQAAGEEASGSEGDLGFTNAASNDYTLLGTSACKDTGVALSGPTYTAAFINFMNSHGGVHYYSDGLDGSYCDFSTTPPTVRMVPQIDYNLWEKGAYIYDGNYFNPPTIRIVKEE